MENEVNQPTRATAEQNIGTTQEKTLFDYVLWFLSFWVAATVLTYIAEPQPPFNFLILFLDYLLGIFGLHINEGTAGVIFIVLFGALLGGALMLVSALRSYLKNQKVQNTPLYVPFWARYSTLFLFLLIFFVVFAISAMNDFLYMFSMYSILIGIPALSFLFCVLKIRRKEITWPTVMVIFVALFCIVFVLL